METEYRVRFFQMLLLPVRFLSSKLTMSLNPSNPSQLFFNKAIQLYGDRAGGQGNFKFAGLAELQESKVVLLQGNAESLYQPADWRRFQRLVALAHRLKKPVVLWNLPLVRITTAQHPTSLALGTAMQKAEVQLLKFPHPILTVFDQEYEWHNAIQELGWGDGTVLAKPPEVDLSELPDVQQYNVKIVHRQADVPAQILELLRDLSEISGTELVSNRLESLRLLTESGR